MATHVLPKRTAVTFGGGDWGVAWFHRALRRTLELCCAATGGHDFLVQHERMRIFLRCSDCGRETSGWRIEVPSRRR